MPAEVKHSLTLKGYLNVEEMRINEISKAGEFEYDLIEALARFDNAEVTIVITEKASVEPIESEEE